MTPTPLPELPSSHLCQVLSRSKARLQRRVRLSEGVELAVWANVDDEVRYCQPGHHTLSVYLAGGEGHDLDVLQSRIEALDAWNWEQRVDETLHRLHLDGATTVGTLSGGNKKRVALAQALVSRPDVLLLDEPTNHLDLATREALAMAINDFDGTVMLVSHDRALLRSVCEDFWLVGRGVVGPFDGDLDDYQRYLLEESRRLREEARKAEQAAAATSKAAAQVEPAAGAAAAAPAVQASVAAALAPAPAAPSTPPAASAGDQREQRRLAALARQQMAEKTRPFKKELEQLDKRLPQLQAERTRLEGLLSQPISPAEMAEAGRSLKACNDEIDSLEERWLELSEQIEQLSAAMSD